MDWNKENIQALLETSDKAVARAVYRVYLNQTESEKMVENTHVNNGIGFTGADAGYLTSLAKFYEKRGYLTQKQTDYARRKVKKYWRQLLAAIKEGK